MTYDNNGNILTASGVTYTYNSANRMLTSTSSSLTTNYLINFLGQRTKKSNSTATTWFIYDENDNIIAEYDGSGNVQNEYVYLDNRPVGLIRSGSLYYIYSDHLQTPRAITDTSNNLKWTWENKESFGNNPPNETISGSTFKFNMRFSGQYFDNETNLNYNLHRDYNPVWGRYIESDPLGLSAGINTYIYVGGNSLGGTDMDGLKEVTRENCDALLKLIEVERNSKLPIFLTAKYNMFSFTRDEIYLNASFDSIAGKVDIDWMVRSSFPIPRLGSLGYYAGKPVWNIINMVFATGKSLNTGKWNGSVYNPFRNMSEEGHNNAPLAANYYWSNPDMTLEKMFAPAIKECDCMLKKGN